MKKSPLVSIVIVTWNNQKDISICLESLNKISYSNFNIIVVDNNSTDDTVKILENYKNVDLLKLQKNIYLCGGNNAGINHAIYKYNPKYILTLNPDTKVTPDFLNELVATLEVNKKAAAVGPKVLFWNNKNEGLINSAGIIYDGFIQAYDRGFMQEDKGQFDIIEKVSAVTGACVLYRVKALEQTGLFWEKIKMYLDEVELSIRLKKQGWVIFYNPKSLIYHSYMGSTNANKELKVARQKRFAWLLIALRHYKFWSKLAMIKIFILGNIKDIFKF